ncbi:MAG: pilus assembly protein N-terminal domain-containing protein, partial [Thermodesulfobacteriota bacterium]
MKKSCIVIFLLIVNLIALSCWGFAQDEAGKELKVLVGEVEIIAVSNPTRIVLGNPNVADVTDVTKNEITLSAKAPGSTTLVFWDNFGEQSYRIRVLSDNAEEIKRRVDYLLGKLNLPGVYTQVAEEEGKVLLLGRVKTAQETEMIAVALGQLKDKVVDLVAVKEEEAVVGIDVQVLELT